MSFVHDDEDFEQLLSIVARETGISAALIEKGWGLGVPRHHNGPKAMPL